MTLRKSVALRAHTERPDFVCCQCGAMGWVEIGKLNEPWECPYCGHAQCDVCVAVRVSHRARRPPRLTVRGKAGPKGPEKIVRRKKGMAHGN